MRIRKWYVDCVTDGGTTFVGYVARLGLGPASLHYRSTLLASPGEPAAQSWTLSRKGAPARDGDVLRWSSQALGVAGTWAPSTPPVHCVLLDEPGVFLDWRCHMPRAQARVQVGSRTLTGTGYVEELIFEGRPRAIPVRVLRWGRFLGKTTSVVWIDWRGPRPTTWVFHDGVQVEDGRVTDDEVRFSHHTLPLGGDGSWTLRDDVVEESVFPNRPRLRALLPRALATLHERKWSGPGALSASDGTVTPGWTIWERVDWP